MGNLADPGTEPETLVLFGAGLIGLTVLKKKEAMFITSPPFLFPTSLDSVDSLSSLF